MCEGLKKHKLTHVGTKKHNLPPVFVKTNSRQENSSLFGIHEECTLLSYFPKKVVSFSFIQV